MSALRSHFSPDDNTLTISIDGRFDFNIHKDFRECYRQAPTDAQFVIDVAGVRYMDSSALGMLLILRERAGGDAARITIRNCGDEVRKILTISNCQKMFEIDYAEA